MSDDFVAAMEAFADHEGEPIFLGRTHSAILVDGAYCEGGITSWSEDGIWIWDGGPMSDFEPFLVPRAELDLDQFYAVAPGAEEAVRLRWDADEGVWHPDGPAVSILSLEGQGPVARLFVWVPDPNPTPATAEVDAPATEPGRRGWWRVWRRS